jgi:tripeptide aminopeptidase
MPPHTINNKRLLQTFTELLAINSPSFDEEKIGRVLAEKLRVTGCDVELQRYDRSFNIVARKKGHIKALPLLLSAHMDTIEPTEGIEFSVDDSEVKTIGRTVLGADDKSAIAQILEALTVLDELKIPHGDLEIVLTSAEEQGLCGAKNLDFSALRSRHALVLDASGTVGGLIIAAPAHLTYELRVAGKSAHAGIEPEKGINAIRVAAFIIASVKDGRISEETTANIGIFQGGTATNVVPDNAVIKGELRSRNLAELEGCRKRLFETAAAIADSNDAEIFITEEDEYRAFTIPRSDPFFQYLGRTFKKCRIEPLPLMTGGGSDANVFNEHGVKAVPITTGMRQVHSKDERISLADLYNGCKVLLQAIADFKEFIP